MKLQENAFVTRPGERRRCAEGSKVNRMGHSQSHITLFFSFDQFRSFVFHILSLKFLITSVMLWPQHFYNSESPNEQLRSFFKYLT